MEGVFQGYGKSFSTVQYNTPDYNKLAHLEQNVYQFSAAKNYQQLREITSLLTTNSHVPFPEFKRKAENILQEYQVRNLRTEYNVAVGSAQMASKWVDFQKHPEALLQYRTVGDARVGDDHRPLDRITRPVSDAFWKTYYPPNRWNCRCTVVRLNTGTPTSDQETNIASANAYPAKGFATNLAETGFIFPANSPYYVGIPDAILKRAGIIQLKAIQKDAIQRLVTNVVTVNRPELPGPILFNKKGIKEAMNQPHHSWELKNQAVQFIDKILEVANYEGAVDYFKDNPMITKSHIFSFAIDGKQSFAIIRENIGGECRFYSISDNQKVVTGIKKNTD